jgi:hypothetical protein
MAAKRTKPHPSAKPQGEGPVLGKSGTLAAPRLPGPIDHPLSLPENTKYQYEFGERSGFTEYGIDAADPALTLYFGIEGSEDKDADFVTEGEHSVLKNKT